MYEFSPYVKDNFDFLRSIAKAKSETKRINLIKTASADQILAIVEICANILQTNFVLTKRQKNRLSHYADFYRSLSRARSVQGAKQKIENQEGSGLALGAILIPVLSVLAQHLLEKVI